MKKFAIMATTTGLCAGLVVAAPSPASAHGTLDLPASRLQMCRFVVPNHPVCQDAWKANAQSIWDWNGLLISDANGRHRQLIPDGELCSANRDEYTFFDRPGDDWPATNLTPDSDGKYTLRWNSTAPHSTAYYRVYVTKQGYNPNQRLAWGDLDLVHDTGARPREYTTTMRFNLPERSGRHMIYVAWQRSDSSEAFYSCSDVQLSSAGSPEQPGPGSPESPESPYNPGSPATPGAPYQPGQPYAPGAPYVPGDSTGAPSTSPPPAGSVIYAPGLPKVKVRKRLRVRIKWQAAEGVDKYRVQVSRDGRSKWRPVAKTDKNRWVGKVKKVKQPRHRYFRVVAINPAGENPSSPVVRARVKVRR
ncbi:MAG: lytic polysaccharide monooxygenase [Actinomycetia bacterium]|nr:lytic polysaccharide monooxygenase [Actinomycetes bacterium]